MQLSSAPSTRAPPARASSSSTPTGGEVARHQLEHRQIMPAPGLGRARSGRDRRRASTRSWPARCAAPASTGHDLAAIGVTNQRETTVVWDPTNGRPWHNAIVWQDTRTDTCRRRARAAPGAAVRAHRAAAGHLLLGRRSCGGFSTTSTACAPPSERGRAVFGTIDTWVIWNLTGGREGGRHVTDVTNASRTQLMDLRTLDWDDELLTLFGIPRRMLPAICPSSSLTGLRRHRPTGPLARRCRSAAASAISMRRSSARSASRRAKPRTPTAPATSCCSTPAAADRPFDRRAC